MKIKLNVLDKLLTIKVNAHPEFTHHSQSKYERIYPASNAHIYNMIAHFYIKNVFDE